MTEGEFYEMLFQEWNKQREGRERFSRVVSWIKSDAELDKILYDMQE